MYTFPAGLLTISVWGVCVKKIITTFQGRLLYSTHLPTPPTHTVTSSGDEGKFLGTWLPIPVAEFTKLCTYVWCCCVPVVWCLMHVVKLWDARIFWVCNFFLRGLIKKGGGEDVWFLGGIFTFLLAKNFNGLWRWYDDQILVYYHYHWLLKIGVFKLDTRGFSSFEYANWKVIYLAKPEREKKCVIISVHANRFT